MALNQMLSDYGVTVASLAGSVFAVVKWAIPWAVRKEFKEPLAATEAKAEANLKQIGQNNQRIDSHESKLGLLTQEVENTKENLDDLGLKMDSLIKCNHEIETSIAVQAESNKRIIDHYQTTIRQVEGFSKLIESERDAQHRVIQDERRMMEKSFSDSTDQLKEQSQMLVSIVQKVVDKLADH